VAACLSCDASSLKINTVSAQINSTMRIGPGFLLVVIVIAATFSFRLSAAWVLRCVMSSTMRHFLTVLVSSFVSSGPPPSYYPVVGASQV
jgi:hypothetical protein